MNYAEAIVAEVADLWRSSLALWGMAMRIWVDVWTPVGAR